MMVSAVRKENIIGSKAILGALAPVSEALFLFPRSAAPQTIRSHPSPPNMFVV